MGRSDKNLPIPGGNFASLSPALHLTVPYLPNTSLSSPSRLLGHEERSSPVSKLTQLYWKMVRRGLVRDFVLHAKYLDP